MAKIGRPKLPKTQRKQVQFAVRLKLEEKRALEVAAKKAGVGVSEWAREVLLAAARTP